MVHFYANNRHAINRTIFFMCKWLWFGILESYAMKRFMRLTDMQLAEVVFSKCEYHHVLPTSLL